MSDTKRTGARNQKDISPLILEQLNKGLIESANLTEWLCVDHLALIRNILSKEYQAICIENIDRLKSKSVMSMVKSIGENLYENIKQTNDHELFDRLKAHKSDSVRCWAAYIVGSNAELSLSEKLDLIQLFAADLHFGVREIAWMAVREDITKDLDSAISILEVWSKNENPNIRRFSSESIRPNGVWCKKIDRLKNNPEIALPILENLKSDSSKYVQDSVANWLNDASKTQPEFVIATCGRWVIESPTRETNYIIKGAQRTIKK
ncbi:DNA alkylation repair enzyme [uncultured Dysgonomonas sp.]|uniref:DNA alkylation repair enzyme n=1 Tax=uncultured Dysgonomonas sp. TaxID=206096 RepID=A0A212K1C0_9BACT|nr:DNA alkylation repair protein [uncultured Dysgonomonas sp.]SBW05501.1 DNA alkylation repair enzyme [uncultured Dysgonomonas sp.]